jgi:cbb3-type cytochrome oxidase subunit 3
MFQKLFADSDLLSLPVLSMLGFIAVFAGSLLWVFARRNRPHFERMARLPLDEETAR